MSEADAVSSAAGSDATIHCSHLGLSDDRSTRCLFPSSQHACFARPLRTWRPDAHTQTKLCLSSAFGECPIFQNASRREVSEISGASGKVPRRRGFLRALRWIGACALAAGGVAVIAWGFLALREPGKQTPVSPVSTVSTAPAGLGVASTAAFHFPQTTPTLESTPSARPSETPIPASATAAPSRSQELTHTVSEGETLSSIAEQYGLDVADLAIRNGISSDSVLYPGDSLIIPVGPTGE